MSNSKLVTCTVLSPNNSGLRTHKIDRITPHIVVGQFYAKDVGMTFAKKERQASCNYVIGKIGDVCLCVDEDKRSWCSSSKSNDQRAVTIECASDTVAPYALNNVVYSKLIELCTDICKRNGKKKLLWISDKSKALAYEPKDDEMLLTVHRWFWDTTECPGDWVMKHLSDLAEKVTANLKPKKEEVKEEFKMTTLKKGSKGEDVYVFESIMAKMGLYTGAIDGSFGSGCVKACNAFQTKYPECGTNGKPDSSFGPACWNKALSLLKA